MSYTAELADYVAGLRYETLPDTTVRAAKRVTLDLLGVLFPATKYGPGESMIEYIRELGGAPSATVVGTNVKTSPPQAALANGTMAADMEQDDVHPRAGTHPSSVYVPALLAVAEHADVSGKDWILALVSAYDVGCRLSMALGYARQCDRGFHPTAITGTFGAVAGAAQILGLDSGGINSALGLAGCQAAGLMTWEMEQEHYTKSFQSGVSARNAVTAAQLTALGYDGPRDTIDGEYNLFTAFSTARDLAPLTDGLGSRYEIELTGYKFYSVCRNIHAPLDIILDLAAEHAVRAVDVAEITVWLPSTMAPVVDNNTLTTHNLQFVVAAALVDGQATRVQTSAKRRADPFLNDLASKITLLADEELEKAYPEHWPARVRVRLTDGRVFEAEREDPRGNPATPVSDQAIEDKFMQMSTTVIPRDQATEIMRCVKQLDALTSIRELTALLSPSQRAG